MPLGASMMKLAQKRHLVETHNLVRSTKKVEIDQQILVHVISTLGGVRVPADFTNVAESTDHWVEIVRQFVLDVLAGNAVWVTSDERLECLRRRLVKGGPDFESICEESARESVTLIRVLSRFSEGLVNDEDVHRLMPDALAMIGAHFGNNQRGKAGHEDVEVSATALASVENNDVVAITLVQDDDQARSEVLASHWIELWSEDRGIISAVFELARHNIKVVCPTRVSDQYVRRSA